MIGFEGANRYGELVRRLSGQDEITPPGLVLEVDRPEWQFLGRTRLWMAVVGVAAVAAKESLVAVVNPTGSGLITVIVGIWGTVGSQVTVPGVRYGMNLAGAVQSTQIVFRDTRLDPSVSGLPKPMTQLWTDNANAAAGGVLGSSVQRNFAVGAVNVDFTWPGPFVLGPGINFGIAAGVVNTAFDNVAFIGYERAAMAEELAQ